MRSDSTPSKQRVGNGGPKQSRGTCMSYRTDEFRKWWDLSVIFMLYAVVLTTPYFIGFDVPSIGKWFVINLVIDMAFIVDVVLNFRTPYWEQSTSRDYILVTDTQKIALKYLRGWFWIDFPTCLPIDAIMMIGSAGECGTNDSATTIRLFKVGKTVRLFRLVRALRFLKVFKFDVWEMLLGKGPSSSDIKYYCKALGSLFVTLIFTSHMCACAWYFNAWVDVYGVGTSKDMTTFDALGSFSSSRITFTKGELLTLTRPQNDDLLFSDRDHIPKGGITLMEWDLLMGPYATCSEHDKMCRGYKTTNPATLCATFRARYNASSNPRVITCDEAAVLEGMRTSPCSIKQSNLTLDVGCASFPCNLVEPHWDHGDKYIASLYWAVQTMTTVGYGDMLPVTTHQRVVATFTMFAGATLFGYMLGSMATVLMQKNQTSLLYQQKVDSIADFFEDNCIPKEIAARVRKHYDRIYESEKVFDEDEIVSDLPRALYHAVSMHKHKELVEMSSFLSTKHVSFVGDIVGAGRILLEQEDQILMREGEVAREIYFLKDGICDVIMTFNDTDHVVGQLRPGDHCGFVGCLITRKHPVSVHCNTFCEALAVPRDKFVSALEDHDELRGIVIRDANATLGRYKTNATRTTWEATGEQIEYEVLVTTSDVASAGTNADCMLMLRGKAGNTEEVLLSSLPAINTHNDSHVLLGRGVTSSFKLLSQDVGELEELVLKPQWEGISSINEKWRCKHAVVSIPGKMTWRFTAKHWLKSGHRKKLELKPVRQATFVTGTVIEAVPDDEAAREQADQEFDVGASLDSRMQNIEVVLKALASSLQG